MQITIDHLTKKFNDVTAVDDLSICLESGKLIVFLGPSGCGKTTVLNILSGILPVTSGRVLFDDKDVSDLPPEKRNVGLVFQNYALYPHMTVLENICFPLEIKRIPRKQRLVKARELAELVHVTELLQRRPSELSGGQQQRVATARALAKDPQLLLLDEPLSNLDAKLRVEMREEILRIQRASKITTVFVTHDQEEASSIADQVVLMKKGLLQQMDTARRMYDEPVNYFVADFLGAPPINKLYGTMQDGKFQFRNSDVRCDLPLRKAVANGTEVILAVRSESVIVPAGETKFKSVVLERYSIGKDELSLLNVEGQQMRAYISGDYPIRIGDPLDFSLKNRGVFLFDAQSGERLA